jgi:hypothetical protein
MKKGFTALEGLAYRGGGALNKTAARSSQGVIAAPGRGAGI